MLTRRGLMVGGCAAAGQACSAPRTDAARARASLGFYALGADYGVRNMPGIERWLGRRVDFVVDNADQTQDWPQVLSSLGWMADKWATSRWRPCIGVPLLPERRRGQLALGAAGAFDGTFVAAGQRLVAAGLPRAHLRLGWEMNGSWQPWSAQHDPKAWIAFYRRAVRAMRSVPGQAFVFDWCLASGDMGMNPALAYPGDDVVDVIGADIYFERAAWLPLDPAVRFRNGYRDARYGLRWHRDFAAAHAKPVSFPEWGLSIGPIRRGVNGAGDEPLFIDAFSDWLEALGPALHSHNYFLRALDRNCDLSNAALFPRAGAAFRRRFGSPA